MYNRFMKILVLFDLPVVLPSDRKEYAQFRRFLIEDGYAMMQFSVYCRTVRNHNDAEKHLQRVKQNLPPEGSVRALLITEKQYENMQILLGEGYANESFLDSTDLLVL